MDAYKQEGAADRVFTMHDSGDNQQHQVFDLGNVSPSPVFVDGTLLPDLSIIVPATQYNMSQESQDFLTNSWNKHLTDSRNKKRQRMEGKVEEVPAAAAASSAMDMDTDHADISKYTYCINKLQEDRKNHVGYLAKQDINISQAVAKNAPNMDKKLAANLTLPAVRNDIAVVGTGAPEHQNYLALVSVEGLNSFNVRDVDVDSIVKSYCLSDKALVNVLWADDSKVVASTMSGEICIYDVKNTSNKFRLKRTTTISRVHSSLGIRDMVMQGHMLATAGNDNTLKVTDLSTGKVVSQSQVFSSPVGSVKWNHLAQNMISITLDGGMDASSPSEVGMFDPRASLSTAALHFTLPRPALYAHEFSSLFDVLLGFGDGDLSHLDIRTEGSRVTDNVKDPYVDCIGHIQYNFEQQAFVSSGIGDFTVWNVDAGGTNNATVHSHSIPGMYPIVTKVTHHNAIFINNGAHILDTDSNGGIAIYNQNWEALDN